MTRFIPFCAGLMMGMGFVLSMQLSLLGVLFTGLSFLIVFMDVTTRGTEIHE